MPAKVSSKSPRVSRSSADAMSSDGNAGKEFVTMSDSADLGLFDTRPREGRARQNDLPVSSIVYTGSSVAADYASVNLLQRAGVPLSAKTSEGLSYWGLDALPAGLLPGAAPAGAFRARL